MSTTPAYAKAKTITSRSGADATWRHIKTLQRAQALLLAQDAVVGRDAAALVIGDTIDAYRRELRTYYQSGHNPYRDTYDREGLPHPDALSRTQ